MKSFIYDFVTRYKDQGVILFYEIGNEYSDYCDIRIDKHPFGLTTPYSGNFTSKNLRDFMRRIANYVRSLDPKGMVTSGNSIPRHSAYH